LPLLLVLQLLGPSGASVKPAAAAVLSRLEDLTLCMVPAGPHLLVLGLNIC
jgi:hypothetical protein